MVEKKIIGKIIKFEKALRTLQEILLTTQQTPHDSIYFRFLRDSLIKRFEYCIDMFWKVLREYILDKHGIDAPASPKAVIKQALDLNIINNEEYAKLITAVNDRNLSSHAYHEDTAERIALHIQSYYALMCSVRDRLKN